MDNFNKVRDMISQSSVPFSEQIDLIDLFSKGSEEDLSDIVELFTEDKMWIERINQNYKAKKNSIETKDAGLWNKIIEEEKKELEEAEKNYRGVI